MFQLFRTWFRRRPPPAFHLIMYTRQGCHLCEDAWRLLVDEQEKYGFTLEQTDVDSDDRLRAEFGEQVPVVTVNGQVRFRGGVNKVLLHRLLQAGTRR